LGQTQAVLHSASIAQVSIAFSPGVEIRGADKGLYFARPAEMEFISGPEGMSVAFAAQVPVAVSGRIIVYMPPGQDIREVQPAVHYPLPAQFGAQFTGGGFLPIFPGYVWIFPYVPPGVKYLRPDFTPRGYFPVHAQGQAYSLAVPVFKVYIRFLVDLITQLQAGERNGLGGVLGLFIQAVDFPCRVFRVQLTGNSGQNARSHGNISVPPGRSFFFSGLCRQAQAGNQKQGKAEKYSAHLYLNIFLRLKTISNNFAMFCPTGQ
jgi:hypothetical protein